jgi:DMSO reductase family type II enzyme iron-sulfur subunit
MGTITQATRQLAWVFDLNRCIGCQTCSVACKVLWTLDDGSDHMWWCTVNTQPGRGTPRDYEHMGGGYDANGRLIPGRLPTAEEWGGAWDFNWEEVYASGKGQEAFLCPLGSPPSWGMNWDEDQGAGEYPNAYFFYLPRLCNHCTRPSCVEACPNGALYKRAEDGLVLCDEDRCRGAQECIRACPYKKIYFNPTRQVSQHCIGCFPRIEKGVAPACVRQCSGRAAIHLELGESMHVRVVPIEARRLVQGNLHLVLKTRSVGLDQSVDHVILMADRGNVQAVEVDVGGLDSHRTAIATPRIWARGHLHGLVSVPFDVVFDT